ncbi:MAG: hypothetical protein MI924_08160 [Chloroflexales bacterium]|nr:hypothetical protein [Chloroflexales bacterium]
MAEEEYFDPDEGKKVLQNGDYLCVQYWEHPVHVYKRVSPGKDLHPATARVEHDGALYGLAWIEEDKE